MTGMRWDNLRLDEPTVIDHSCDDHSCDGTASDSTASDSTRPGAGPVPLFARNAITRTFDTPGFRGMTFYEIQAKSIVSRVPESSRVSFRWTINPYRGCQHSCLLLLCPQHAHLP